MKYFFPLVLFLLCNTALSAQQKESIDSIYIHGRVVEALSLQPLEHAEIVAVDAKGDTVSRTQSVDYYKLYNVDSNGDVLIEFSLGVPTAGNYTLIISKAKFMTLQHPIVVPEKQNGKRVTLFEVGDLPLERGINLKEATVRASKIMMLVKGDTVVYNADAFQLAEGSLLDKLIEQLPGVSLHSGGQIMVNGEFVSSLLIDGKDFFNGDATVALRNLPAYAVNKVRVYRKEAEDSYLMAPDSTTKAQNPLVMDVRLKKEFHERWLSNVDAGGGTHHRYNVRGFGMRTNDISRLSVYGRLNNVGDTQRPTESDAWSIEDFSTQPLTDQEGGADFHWTSRRTKNYFTASVKGGQQWETIGNTAIQRNFLTDGTTTNSMHATTGESERRHFEYNGRLVLPLRNTFIEVASLLNYHKENDDALTHGAITTSALVPSLSLFDSLRLPSYATLLMSDTRSKSYHASHQLEAALGLKVKFVSPWTGNGITLRADGSFADGKTRSGEDLDRFTPDSQFNLLEKKMATLPTQTYNLGTGIDYEMRWRAWQWTLSYGFSHTNNERSRDVFVAEALGGTALPAMTMDVINSYRYADHNNKHEVRSEWRTWINKHALTLRLPLSFEHATAHDSRTTFVHPHYIFFQPSFTWLSPWGLHLHYRLNRKAPELSQLFNLTDSYDTQMRYQGNPHLKASLTHNVELNYSGRAQRHAQSWHANGHWSVERNKIVWASILDMATGSYTFTPENVSGDYLLGFNGGYSCNLGADNRWAFSTTAEGTWEQQHFLATTLGTHPLPAVLNYVNSFNTKMNARLTRRIQTLQAALKAGIYHLSAKAQGGTPLQGTDWTTGVVLTYNLPLGFQVSSDFTFFLRSGYENTQVRRFTNLWNSSLSKSFGKHCSVRLEAYDLLRQLHNTERLLTATYWQETTQLTIPRYLMLHLAWQF